MKTHFNIKVRYKPETKEELTKLVNDLSIKLWEIDTSLIKEMRCLFRYSKRQKNKDFEGIEYWDVSNVKDMSCLFSECTNFNHPIGYWNVSNVTTMIGVFYNCKSFNQPLNKWDVSNVKYMTYMFSGCKSFNQPLNNWDISNVDKRYHIFENCNIKEEFKPKGEI